MVETANSSLGLEFILSVNSTEVPSEDAINMSASILNLLPTEYNLSAANDWAVRGLSAGSCNLDATPIGFGVFRGFYDVNNVSSAGRPLFMWAMVSCRASRAWNVTSYSFLPGGPNGAGNDRGSYAGYYLVASSASSTCSSTGCTYYPPPEKFAKGVFPEQFATQATVYAANGTGFYNSLGSSLPSSYTLVAGDEWGQIVLIHFTVTPSNNLPVVGSFLASSGSCQENGNPVPCETSEFSGAFIFNCRGAASTSVGCTTRVESWPGGSAPVNYYTITVWYPYVNHTGEPTGDNCMYSVKGETPPASSYAYCFNVNSTAFAMSLG